MLIWGLIIFSSATCFRVIRNVLIPRFTIFVKSFRKQRMCAYTKFSFVQISIKSLMVAGAGWAGPAFCCVKKLLRMHMMKAPFQLTATKTKGKFCIWSIEWVKRACLCFLLAIFIDNCEH